MSFQIVAANTPTPIPTIKSQDMKYGQIGYIRSRDTYVLKIYSGHLVILGSNGEDKRGDHWSPRQNFDIELLPTNKAIQLSN